MVTQPTNNPPVPSFTYTCNQNVCTFDGRGSTDENAASLTYTWNFGTSTGSTANGSGPLPTRTFTGPGTFPVTLTVRDEWQVSATTVAQNVTIVEPTGNTAPVPTFTQSCLGLTCSVSSQGTADPNTGDTIAYSWNWGDGTARQHGRFALGPHLRGGGQLHDHAHDHGRLGQVRLDHPHVNLVEPAEQHGTACRVHRYLCIVHDLRR